MDAHAHRRDLASISDVVLPGTRRPMLRVEDHAYLEEHTDRSDQPRVRPPFEPLAGASPTELASRRLPVFKPRPTD